MFSAHVLRVPLDLLLQAWISDPIVLRPRSAEAYEVISKNAALRCAYLILTRTDNAEGRNRMGPVFNLQISGLVSVQPDERIMFMVATYRRRMRVECENDQISGS